MSEPRGYDRKVIFVPTVPSSGSSAIAAILHHLGVDMGLFNHEEAIRARGYPTYEDTQTALFSYAVNPETTEPIQSAVAWELMDKGMRFHDYLNYRLDNSESLVGFKAKADCWRSVKDPRLLPIVTIDISRPLDTCIAKDLDRLDWHHQKYRSKADFETWCRTERLDLQVARTKSIASCWIGKRHLLSAHPPIFTCGLENVLQYPKVTVDLLSKTLGNEFKHYPSKEQREAAVESIYKEDE
jgi:hypothetical protein